MPRKYVPRGRPNGGKREGAGRPPGTTSPLGYGETAAVRAAGLRVPEAATKAERELADRAQQRIIDVMEGRVFHKLATPVLGAARTLREEVCGPVKQRVEHSFAGLTDEQLEAKYLALTSSTTVAAPPEATAASEEESGQ